jgi:hypothetical protein
MKTLLFFLFGFILFSIFVSSCKLIGGCEDKTFSTSKIPYNGNQLKINGYYYGDTLVTENRPTIVRINYFFQNGIVIYSGANLEQLTLSTPALFLNTTNLNASKESWGVFRIVSNKLSMESWIPRLFDCLGTIQDEAEIINDSTYLLKRTNKIYRFRSSIIKPDSTNSFIK